MTALHLIPDGLGSVAGRHVVLMSWRDTRNPEAGGAELYLEQIATGLVRRGAAVTVFTAAYAGAPGDEVIDGVRYVRRGSKLSVYARGLQMLASGRLGRPDVIVDVQNGMPFFTRLVAPCPVVVLMHHVHREQWPVVYPGLTGRVGWLVERRIAPRLYRDCQYVAVSRATRDELVPLGVDAERIAVVHNGTTAVPVARTPKVSPPTICVVGRIVPHKRVELAVDAWHLLRKEIPDLQLRIVGDGWWADELRAHAVRVTGSADHPGIVFEGHVSEARKREVYAESWVMALPSLKEGWGLVVGEAGMHHTPTVAYAAAGGTRESIADGVSGLLLPTDGDVPELAAALGAVLRDDVLRARLARGARAMSDRFTWERAQDQFAGVLGAAMAGIRIDVPDSAPENDSVEAPPAIAVG